METFATMSQNYRAEFDIPRDICYLNAAYMTPQPRRVLEATIRGATQRSQPWQITPAPELHAAPILWSICGPFSTAMRWCRPQGFRATPGRARG